MQLLPPLILEDWEDYLKELHPEPGPILPYSLSVEVVSWPHEATELFQRASPPRPYIRSSANPDEHRRMIWVLSGMRSYLAEKLSALIQSYCVASGSLPQPGDEFIVKADEDESKQWAGIYAIKKRIIVHSDNGGIRARILVDELEWEEGVTGFAYG